MIKEESKVRVSWEVVEGHSGVLATNLVSVLGSSVRDYKIIGVSRGGLIPAILISHILDIPIVKAIEGTISPISTPIDEGLYIIVDDICDTGDTFGRIRTCFPNAWLVSLFLKPKGRLYRNISVQEVPQSCWVVFPWEMDNAEEVRDQDRIAIHPVC